MGETVVQGRREPLRSFQFWLPESEHEQWMAFSGSGGGARLLSCG